MIISQLLCTWTFMPWWRIQATRLAILVITLMITSHSCLIVALGKKPWGQTCLRAKLLFYSNKECFEQNRAPFLTCCFQPNYSRQWKPIMLQMCNAGRPWTSKSSRPRSCTQWWFCCKCDVCDAIRPSALFPARLLWTEGVLSWHSKCRTMDHATCNLALIFDGSMMTSVVSGHRSCEACTFAYLDQSLLWRMWQVRRWMSIIENYWH